jgi:hypothetical protein
VGLRSGAREVNEKAGPGGKGGQGGEPVGGAGRTARSAAGGTPGSHGDVLERLLEVPGLKRLRERPVHAAGGPGKGVQADCSRLVRMETGLEAQVPARRGVRRDRVGGAAGGFFRAQGLGWSVLEIRGAGQGRLVP